MPDLALYLAAVRQRRWQPGVLDCCTFMADWLMRRGCADPMADRRGAYSNVRQFKRLIRGEGGLVQSCSARFAGIGLLPTHYPAAGAVALVLAPVAGGRGARPTGAICVSSELRAVVSPDIGLVIARLRTLSAWAV
jgi:hypothetical protein